MTKKYLDDTGLSNLVSNIKGIIPKVYYGTCNTAESTTDKVVVCPNFVLETGATISILFEYGAASSTDMTLNVNNTGAKKAYRTKTRVSTPLWSAGEVVSFTYDGNNRWIMHKGDTASTSQYGLVRLSNSVTSTSPSDGATSKAVKMAYDLADSKQDELVSGTNIKTINGNSILGSGNISISGGSATDVQINGTSITSNNEANIITESVYDETTNKIATMDDIAKSSNYIIVSPNAEQTLGNTNVTICGLNTIVSYYGTLLSLNTTQKGIVVGNGVNHIEVSGSHYITAVGTAGLKNVYIYKNNDAVSRAIMYVTNNYCILGIPPTIIPVTSGDLITMRIQSQNGTTTKFASSTDGVAVRLVARVID